MSESRLLSKKIAYPLFILAGFLFVFICRAERDLAENGNILWTSAYTSKLLIVSALFGGLLGAAMCFAVYFVCCGHLVYIKGDGIKRERSKKPGEGIARLFGEKQVMLCSSVLSVLAWLPAYLAYYPGICAYDTPIQLGQIMDGYMIDHHPIAHTLLLKLAVWVGQRLWGSVNAGMGIYTFCQMTFLAFGFAYALGTLKKLHVSDRWICVMQLCIMFYPFNAYMAVSTTKDTVFTGFFLIMMSAFMRLLLEGGDFRDDFRIRKNDLIFFIASVGAILFRNNCRYAIMVLLPFVFLTAAVSLRRKKNGKLFTKLFMNVALSLLVGSIALTALFYLTNAEQGDRREMLSMPIQQFARCMLYHGGIGELPEDDGTMDEESKDLIDDFLLDEAYREYEPGFADPVKSRTNTYVARYRAGDFIGTYLRLLGNYPGDFINAALALDAGYLYPGDESHAHINEEEGNRGRGYVQTYWFESDLTPRGLTRDSKWISLHERMEDWADKNAYLDIPLLKYIFVPGTFLWLYVLFAGILLIQRKYRLLLPVTLAFGYYATLFLGPTVQLRYIFPLMTVLPFMALSGFAKGKNGND